MSEIYCGQATKYLVNLTDDERARLHAMLNKGTGPARPLTRARILLAADRNDSDETIAYALHVYRTTVAAVRKRCVESGLDAALFDAVRPGAPRKLDGVQEAFTIALTCTQAPEGQKRWTMQLLADKLVSLGVVDSISDECVRETLKKTIPSRGSAKNGASRR
ncbi:MAG TPA: helix-turn-helix domain-containing protein [Armatimonadota bacterium]|jgi:transposase